MSDIIEIKVPDIGDVGEVEVIEVSIQPGDVVELEQSLLVMETDKASMELPSTARGTIQEVKVKVGDKVSEGSLVVTLLKTIDSDSVSKTPEISEKPIEIQKIKTVTEEVTKTVAPSEKEIIITTPSNTNTVYASPGVRRFARELGADLSKISVGSGRKGRLLKEDIKNFVKQSLSKKSSNHQMTGSGIPALPTVNFSKFGDTEEKPLSKIKRLTGKNLSCNWLNLPMVTQHEEADITEMEAFRKALNVEQVASQQIKVTPLAFIIKAVLAAMKAYPQFNSSLSADGERLIYKKYFNIGIAVDTPNGLVVPVIKQADQKSILELVESMRALSFKAREGKLLPADMQGGCFTISSLGGIGGTGFTPIVNAPEVAILGVARASMKPVWDGKEFIPKLMLPLDLTYDHRVIDGADGARFVVAITKYLNDVRRLLL
ncbi:MAG: dihydrolipoyllysine-residue acetyltransferase [Methylococcales bacterium]|nr:dihydrolipoyllysine-residue acetyltransferase [Methylococcales bacterium]